VPRPWFLFFLGGQHNALPPRRASVLLTIESRPAVTVGKGKQTPTKKGLLFDLWTELVNIADLFAVSDPWCTAAPDKSSILQIF
jgi:hypothetical protein